MFARENMDICVYQNCNAGSRRVMLHDHTCNTWIRHQTNDITDIIKTGIHGCVGHTRMHARTHTHTHTLHGSKTTDRL